jgi:hypothetical protein
MGQLSRPSTADLEMPFQVKSGALTVITHSVTEAVALFDRLVEEAGEAIAICDMDGHEILPDTLRALIEKYRQPS